MASFHFIKTRELTGMKLHNRTEMYDIYTAKYRMNTVVVKKPKFAFASERLERVTYFSLCGNKETFAIVGKTTCVAP